MSSSVCPSVHLSVSAIVFGQYISYIGTFIWKILIYTQKLLVFESIYNFDKVVKESSWLLEGKVQTLYMGNLYLIGKQKTSLFTQKS